MKKKLNEMSIKEKAIEILTIHYSQQDAEYIFEKMFDTLGDEDHVYNIVLYAKYQVVNDVSNIQEFGYEWFKENPNCIAPDYVIRAIDFEKVVQDLSGGDEYFVEDFENKRVIHIF